LQGARAGSDDPAERSAVERVRGGDASAYDYLVRKHLRRTVSIIWNIVRNAADAEELAQEAFVRAYQRIDRFEKGQPFGPWVYRIAVNLSLDLLKHRRRVRHEEIDGRAVARERTDAAAESHEAGRRIEAALLDLPGQQRLVATLYLVEELSHEEIAATTGLSEGTVRSHLSLARKKLQDALSDLRRPS
jgi:RNA polymerase sigma-70 factor, ECF subfamily